MIIQIAGKTQVLKNQYSSMGRHSQIYITGDSPTVDTSNLLMHTTNTDNGAEWSGGKSGGQMIAGGSVL